MNMRFLASCIAAEFLLCGVRCIAVSQNGVRFIRSVEYVKPVILQEKALSARTLAARETLVSPKIDGLLGDDCWKGVGTAKDFILFQTDEKRAPVQTQAKFVFTKDVLFCNDPDMKGLLAQCTNPNGNVWYDDCVELWLDVNLIRQNSFHILVNPLGTVAGYREWDEEVGDPLAIQAVATKMVHYSDLK